MGRKKGGKKVTPIRADGKSPNYTINPEIQFSKCPDSLINTLRFNDDLLFSFNVPFGSLENIFNNTGYL